MMERLCAFALERDIETEYVQRLIARRGLQRPAPDIANWPWPLRVFTLGRFVAGAGRRAGPLRRARSRRSRWSC